MASVRWAMRKAYGGLAGVIKAEEQQFGVFVRQTELGQHVPDCVDRSIVSPDARERKLGLVATDGTYTSR